MEQWLEYAFIGSLFVIFASLASLGMLFYTRHFSSEARLLRSKLHQIQGLRKSDGIYREPEGAQKKIPSFSENLLERITKAAFLNDLIVGSGTKIRPIEVLGISGLLAAIGLVLSIIFAPKGIIAVVPVLLFPTALAATPFLFLQQKAVIRRRKFDEKFPEALGLMARSLQAGSGLTSALGMAASEVPDPCGTEFKKAFDEINFGISFNDAISNMSLRVKSQDLNFFVTALLIQRETGGNLAELLNGLAHTIRERQKLARKVQIISAEGRLSGNVLIALPLIMVALLSIINPTYISLLWSTKPGQSAIYFGLTMMIIGAFLIRRIVNIKV